jgi:biopolymer transport protein ExbB/TolQ
MNLRAILPRMNSKARGPLIGLVVSLVIVVVAPILGVLGSSLLMIRSFDQTRVGDPSEKAERLGQGISGAMNSTVLGVVAGIVALIPCAYFTFRLYQTSRSANPTTSQT